MGSPRKISIGDRFGRLVVLEDLGVKDYGTRRFRTYLCRCDCGKEKALPGTELGRGHKSCGCLHDEGNEKALGIGERFGRLTVIHKTDTSRAHSRVYECVCDCGNVVDVRRANLVAGNTTSCGCLHDEKFSEVNMNHFDSYIDGTQIAHISNGTISKNNTSGVRGVCWNKQKQKWTAYIRFRDKRYFLGGFNTKNEAAEARRQAEDEIYKPFLDTVEPWFVAESRKRKTGR
jgi:hypothetical protein